MLEAENENLKQVLTNLAARFSMLGSVFAAKGAAGMGAAATDGSSVATLTPDQDGASLDMFSPGTVFTPAMEKADAGASATSTFAEIPDFPYASQQSTPLAPALSLAEALGSPQT